MTGKAEPPMKGMVLNDVTERIRSFWDEDAATYDGTPGHYPQTPAEWAAWRGALESLLPPAPSRVLDVGAGTGFLSIAVAGLGHTVTAVDLSERMLARLTAKVSAQHLTVTAVQASANEVPMEGFDVVMSRHLVWTLADPEGTLRAWRAAAPDGRLLLVETPWGPAEPTADRIRGQAWGLARRLTAASPPHHHAEYDEAITGALPYADGLSPEQLIELVERSGWRAPRVRRLTDVEWIWNRQMSLPERLFGSPQLYAVWAN